MTTQAIALMQHFYTPNILILISRILAQIQITGAAYIHPQRSLFALGLMLTVLNVVAAFLHLLDFAGGMNGGKGLVLDFIGQGNSASTSYSSSANVITVDSESCIVHSSDPPRPLIVHPSVYCSHYLPRQQPLERPSHVVHLPFPGLALTTS